MVKDNGKFGDLGRGKEYRMVVTSSITSLTSHRVYSAKPRPRTSAVTDAKVIDIPH